MQNTTIGSYDVANYFLAKDPNRKMFNKKLVQANGRSFCEGNARLNEYLHIAQNLYIAKTGRKLFQEDLYARDDGAVEPNVQENYSVLLERENKYSLDSETIEFLDRVFAFLKNASLDELVEISREDSEWQKKHANYNKTERVMDSMAHVEEYRDQYADALYVMKNMGV